MNITPEQLIAWKLASDLASKGEYEKARALKDQLYPSDVIAIEKVISRHQANFRAEVERQGCGVSKVVAPQYKATDAAGFDSPPALHK